MNNLYQGRSAGRAAGAAAQGAMSGEVCGKCPKNKKGQPCTSTSYVMKIIMYGMIIVGLFCSISVIIIGILGYDEDITKEMEDPAFGLVLISMTVVLIIFLFLAIMWLEPKYTLLENGIYIKRVFLSDLEISYQELAFYAKQWRPFLMSGRVLLVSESGLIQIPFGMLRGGCKFCELLCMNMGLNNYSEYDFMEKVGTTKFNREDVKARKKFCKSIRKNKES